MSEMSLEEMEMRCSKMSFLLGMASGILFELHSSGIVPEPYKDRVRVAVDKINSGIDSLYYNEHEK